MTRESLIRRERFTHYMIATAEKNGKDVDFLEMLNFSDWLHRCEVTLSRLAEQQCCDPYFEGSKAQQKQERTENRVEKAIKEKIGCNCYTQRDPRGCMIRLYLVDYEGKKAFNNFDGETCCINW